MDDERILELEAVVSDLVDLLAEYFAGHEYMKNALAREKILRIKKAYDYLQRKRAWND